MPRDEAREASRGQMQWELVGYRWEFGFDPENRE